MADDWLTVRDAAQLAGYHPKHLLRLIRAGKIKAEKFSIVWRVDRRSLLTYLKEVKKFGGKRGPKRGY